MIAPMINDMLNATTDSLAQMRQEISDVRYGPIESGIDIIYFNFRGENYKGLMLGRNRDLYLTGSPSTDAGIALRVLIDQDAWIYVPNVKVSTVGQ